MKNIWIVLIPSFTAYVGFICAIIGEILKRPKIRWLNIVIFSALIIALFVFDMPIYKDMVEKDTAIVTAEYIEFQTGSTLPCTRKAYFKSKSSRFYVYVPTWTRDIAKMEVGKTYEIEFFRNSNVIKEYRLIE